MNIKLSRRSKRLLHLLYVLLFLTLTGCGSNYEPNDLAYVLLMGVEHGTANLLRITYLIAIPKEIGGGGEGSVAERGKGSMVVTVESPSLYASMNLVNTFVGRRLSLMHSKGLIFSEAMARDGTMAKFVPALTQFREMRGTVFLGVSRESPAEILDLMKPLLEANPAKYIELMANNERFTGFIPSEQLQQFYDELKVEGVEPVSILFAKSDDTLPQEAEEGRYRNEGSYMAGNLIKKGGVKIETMGGAVFKSGKMVGELNGNEIRLYSMFRNKYNKSIYAMQDPQSPDDILSMEVFKARDPRIKVRLTENGAVIEVKLSLEGNILGNTSLIDYALPENRKVLEEAFAGRIRNEALALIQKCQHDYQADILGFGKKARRLVLTDKQWQALNWHQLFETAAVSVEVDYKIRRTGTLIRIMPVINPEQGVREGEDPR